MSENPKLFCPECDRDDPTFDVDRRDFMRIVSSHAAGLVALGSGAAGTLLAADSKADPAKGNKTAEGLIKELYATFAPEQKKEMVLPWDHGVGSDGKGVATRNRIYNSALGKKIGDAYTKPQQELVDRILRAIASDEEGYQRITRNGHFDNSGSLQGCGATIFGDPEGKQFAYLFTSHHLTLRCDGNSVEGAAWGGPVYYGHVVDGYSEKNVFFYQTKGVQSVFDALSENQRKKAVVTGNNPGEGLKSVEFRKAEAARPGVNYGELTQDQRKLVEGVMRDILSPFRKEDGDEVMQIIKATGGMEKISLAFYQDKEMNDNHRWHFWRLEGPGFVWNYRPLPHVHCYVNISSKIMG